MESNIVLLHYQTADKLSSLAMFRERIDWVTTDFNEYGLR